MSNQRPRYRAPFAPTVIVDGHARTSLQYLADQPFDACLKHHYLPAIAKHFGEPNRVLLDFLKPPLKQPRKIYKPVLWPVKTERGEVSGFAREPPT